MVLSSPCQSPAANINSRYMDNWTANGRMSTINVVISWFEPDLALTKMGTSTFYMSLPTPFLKPQKPPNQIFTTSSSSNNNKFNSALQHYALHKPKSFLIHKTSVPVLLKKQCRLDLFIVRAVAENAEESEVVKPKEVIQTLQLGAMFGIWYLLNICYNIYNKQVLKVFPFPATVTASQFGCGTLLILFMWGFRLHPIPKISKSQVTLSPLWCLFIVFFCFSLLSTSVVIFFKKIFSLVIFVFTIIPIALFDLFILLFCSRFFSIWFWLH